MSRSCSRAHWNVLSRWMRDDVRLVLAPYDQDQWRDGNLFSDFLAMIGPKDASGFEFISEPINAAWPESVIEMLRVFNRVPIGRAEHAKLVAEIEALWRSRPDAFPRFPLLTDAERDAMRRAMAEELPKLRPYYREGFDERFLTQPLGELGESSLRRAPR